MDDRLWVRYPHQSCIFHKFLLHLYIQSFFKLKKSHKSMQYHSVYIWKALIYIASSVLYGSMMEFLNSLSRSSDLHYFPCCF